jgi:hypothetical protein
MLPAPELNPLTNPVLGRNMGRWAEVYFTSPPEKREQAVQELLRELEQESPGEEAATQTVRAASDQTLDPRQAAPLLEEFVQCPGCGQETYAQQKFCGGCGAPLAAQESLSHSDTRNGADTQGSASPEPGVWEAGERRERFGEDRLGEEKTDLHSAPPMQSIHDIGFSWERAEKSIANEPPLLFADYRRAHRRRNRALMAAALTILIGTFLYVAGRVTSGWVRATPSPPVPTVKSADRAAASADRAPSPVQNGLSPVEQDVATNPAQRKASGAVPSPQSAGALPSVNAQSSVAAGSQRPGSEELAVAESYLSGAQGKFRDSREAAKWLWKSVAKQNAEATLLLSDLYVRGDGVPQSCDQARLLLDAAASKGAPGAGERIRNLPNVGCQ